MSDWALSFAPFFAWPVLACLAALAGLFCLYGLIQKTHGAWLRLLAWALLTLALANPSFLQEDRAPLKTIVALVVDETDSQKINDRDQQTQATAQAFKKQLQQFPHFELREVTVKNKGAADNDASSALFHGLNQALHDVPPERIGGALLLTDGQVHDIPKKVQELGFNAPIHALISGHKNERDRQIIIKKAPRFGIVGESQEILYSVIDRPSNTAQTPIEVEVLIDGELAAIETVLASQESSFVFDVPHGGKTVIEMRVAPVANEITTVNNQAFTVLDGIRENLRVLLVSGEPHGGERTWRNLLKSDASVDLVHFTILRPPEKQDGTPVHELSLIAFPIHELFIEKIDEFDLIIFDRYKRRGVLPVLYFDNIARYVEDGGAILIAAGPEHADVTSIQRTPLASILPVQATGSILEQAYRPKLSETGRRHPVTRHLPGLQQRGAQTPDQWSQWFRLIENRAVDGDVLMQGDKDTPLLVLSRQKQGRVAMLMSDHIWLWARGFNGGGPHSTLLRRLSHWLMKEPELNEEVLRAQSQGNKITIQRQTLKDAPEPLRLFSPDNKSIDLPFKDKGDGLFEAEYEAQSLGLYRAENNDLTALTHVGPANPQEYSNVVATSALLQDIVRQSKGMIARMQAPTNNTSNANTNTTTATLPRIVPVKGNGALSGKDWMGFKTTHATVLKGVVQWPLFAGLLGLALLLFAFASMWAREGR